MPERWDHEFPLPRTVNPPPSRWLCLIRHLWILTGSRDEERHHSATWRVPYARKQERTVFRHTCARCRAVKRWALPWYQCEKRALEE